MTLEIYEGEQRTPEWFELRRGIPTASEFAAIMAESQDRAGRATLMRRLVAETITGEVGNGYSNDDMRRGAAVEPEALASYCLVTGHEVRRVAFGRRDDCGGFGASPDGLIGEDAGVEFKSMRPDLLVDVLLSNKISRAHWWQMQGNMLVFGRQWWVLCIYGGRKMPLFRQVVSRDPDACAKLCLAIHSFNREKNLMVEVVKAWSP